MPFPSNVSRRRISSWAGGTLAAVGSFVILTIVGCYRNRVVGPQAFFFPPNQAGNVIISVVAGVLVGAFLSEKGKPFRKIFWYLVLAALVVYGIFYANPPWSYVTWFLVAAITTWRLLRVVAAPKGPEPKPTTFGSAEWADQAELQRMRNQNIIGSAGLFLGNFHEGGTSLYYTGQRHLLTVAPTRAGKGVTAIIPNLLTYEGSALVIDPKGENAKITALRRGKGDPGRNIPGLGQDVHVVDPWGITGLPVSTFNPMAWLDPNDQDIEENAMMLADSIVVPRSAGGEDAFWDDEAKALLMGIILYVATDAGEETRTLGRVRDIIVSSEADFEATFQRMFQNKNPIVKSTAARHASKDEKLRGSVLASLQSHTHFLDSPRIRKSVSGDGRSFKFEDMKHNRVTVYLVLPADRLGTFGRWLRLLVQQAITMNARNIEREPAKPILFLLDEMAALGKLAMVEQAFGLMAGFGMQMWGIVQDASQLERIYGKGWETFVGNSGVLQYLGSRDQKTAEYFSKLCGVSTIVKTSLSNSIARAFGQGGGSTTHSNTTNTDHIQRHLVFPDELMVFRKDQVLLLVENFNPIDGRRVRWFDDPQLKPLGVNLKQVSTPPALVDGGVALER